MKSLLLTLVSTMISHAAPQQTEDRFETPDGDSLAYLLIRPADSTPDTPLPMLVFLHGSGERGDDLELLKLHGPPKQALEGEGLPFVVLAPQCPAKQWWNAATIIALTKQIAKEQNIDPARIHLTGLSMGGFGTWDAIAEDPALFASAVPICGGGDPKTAAAIKDIPIWAIHGEDDKAVPVAKTRQMEKALRHAGAKQLRTTYYPGVGHDSWTQAYSDPALYAWMMIQSR